MVAITELARTQLETLNRVRYERQREILGKKCAWPMDFGVHEIQLDV